MAFFPLAKVLAMVCITCNVHSGKLLTRYLDAGMQKIAIYETMRPPSGSIISILKVH